MSRLASLEAKKLMRELDFLKSDLDYKNEVVSEADGKFMSCVNDFLQFHPELQSLFDNKINERFEKIVKSNVGAAHFGESLEKENRNEASPKMKKLYREVAKLTHPDKVTDERMKDIYLEAGESYRADDLIGMYSVCEKLGLDYEVDGDDLLLLRNQIESAKSKIAMLESTTTWVWNSTDDESTKREIILRYVGTQIR